MPEYNSSRNAGGESHGKRTGKLLAVSDLHAGISDNQAIVAGIHPQFDDDWLLVAGDVGEISTDIERTLKLLANRFAKVVWAPGNHELWTVPKDPVQLRGEPRYRYLVERLRSLGVVTPEDPYPVWEGPDGPLTIAPLFVHYDYSFRTDPTLTKEESLARANDAGIVCTDEYMLDPTPYSSMDDWCRARVAYTEKRLAEVDPGVPLVLVNHYPLVPDPTHVLHYPEFAQWCGTQLTGDWHRRFSTAAVVYGHLHIPRTTWYDGVRFEEVSIGYPREWRARGLVRGTLREIFPDWEQR
ncbi:metallophosphoesterase [Streptomyces sp. H27-C3]|uniref:metallophosphoesterase family protein n=1 Tax=Streptomyces sp. H27-C3 TaxID=3046305 RepID=UPI0024B87975|nr:metallophosphoesterase [Streptomyces sp. H27-C3]MDJ0464191.1 metallophosphoesterase [Streptomyces sp. H27-C3]